MFATVSLRGLSRRALVLAATWSVSYLGAQEAEKLTYDDHVRPLLENKCFSCHNPDKKKGGLDLTSYAALLAGGGGGAVVDPGNPAGSRLWTCSAKKEEPYMPPEGAPLEVKDQTLLSKWIAGGVLQAKGSVARKANKPKVDLAFNASAGKPNGPVARPENVLLEPVVVTDRTTAIVAMAASPWTSLLAVAGQKQILLYDTESHELAGVLPYAEGFARSLKFSANGSLLVMGGGRAGKLGHAVVWDVKTGRRVTEVGKEFDQIMGADISANHRLVAIGTNAKRVKCFDTASGEVLYTIAKHTEWVTAVGFSPDGILLASADRNGNVMVWEAENGGEFFNLGQHKASVVDLAWRADSNVLASCSLDGTVSVWEMKTGKRVANWTAHAKGVQSVAFTPDGKIVTAGSDGNTAMWTVDGKRLEMNQGVHQEDIVSKVVALSDSKTFVTGNWMGEVRFFEVGTGRELTRVSSNPPKIEQRIADTEKRLGDLEALLKVPAAPGPTAEQQAELKLVQETEVRLAPLQAQIDAVTKERDALRVARDKTTNEAERTEIRKKMTALKEKITPVMTASEKDRAFLRTTSSNLAWLNGEINLLEARIKEADQSLDYFQKLKPKVQGKELENAELNLTQWTKKKQDFQTELAKVQSRLALVQKTDALEAQRRTAGTEIQGLRQRLVYLRAAQFNVGVISEREKLLKLQGDITDLQAAKVENEHAKVADAHLIESTQKALEGITGQLPELTEKVQGQQAAVKAMEQTLTSQRLAESAAAAKVEAQNKLIKQLDDAFNEVSRAREVELARAKALADEYARSTMRPVRLKLGELGVKLEENNKQVADLKVTEEKAKSALDQALGAVTAAEAKAQATQAEVVKAQAQVKVATDHLTQAENLYAEARSWRAWFSMHYFAQLEWSQQGLAKAQGEKQQALAQEVDAGRKLNLAKEQLVHSHETVRVAQSQLKAVQKNIVDTEANGAPFLKERDDLRKVQAAQFKEQARILALPAGIDKDYQPKIAAQKTAVQEAKDALVPLQKVWEEAKQQLSVASQPLDKLQAVLNESTKALAELQQRKVAAEKAIAGAEKDIPQREKNLVEIAQNLATLEPQVEPMKTKVKAAEAQYLAMLPASKSQAQ